MSRNYQRKDPGVWKHEPFEVLPNRPSRQAITVLHDADGHPYVVDAEIDHLFPPRSDRRVWTEADGTMWTELYETGYNSHMEQKARTLPLEQFIWEVWNVNPLGSAWVLLHENEDHRDYRIANLTRISKREAS